MRSDTIEKFVSVGQFIPPNGIGYAYIKQTDNKGNLLWKKTMSERKSSFASLIITKKNEIVACGDAYAEPTVERPRGCLVKFDENGNQIWSTTFSHHTDPKFDEYLYDIVELKDGSYIVVGSSRGTDARGRITQDAWMARIDSNGCISPTQCPPLSVNKKQTDIKTNIEAFPNPAKESITLQHKLNGVLTNKEK